MATNGVGDPVQGSALPLNGLRLLLLIDVYLLQYRYNQPNLAPLVQSIIRIVLNTLESQYHRCYRLGIGATLSHGHPSATQHQMHAAATMRMREQSQGSFEGDHLDADAKGYWMTTTYRN